jgi:DnaK suppressor protein
MALSKEEMLSFKQKLEQIRRSLTNTIRETTEDVKNLDQAKGYSQHQADEGTDDFGRTVNLEISNKESLVLRQVERALEKIDEGTYGLCDVTGKEIPIKRLQAIPYATMTVDAQEKFEKGLL